MTKRIASPALTIVVIFYDMPREAERTLYSLSADYQRDVTASQYEVIAIDNGSKRRICDPDLSRFGSNFRYVFHETDAVSPVAAINSGIAMATGDQIAIIIDGARMASPGLVRQTLEAAGSYPGALIGALAWHLGPEDQRYSIPKGYNTAQEDALLAKANWKDNGYALFTISALCPSSEYGIKGGMPPELSYIVADRETWQAVKGFDERFETPGGGFVNYDTLERLLEYRSERPIILAGEGTFHQMHGGISSNASESDRPHAAFSAEYRAIRDRDFLPPEKTLPRFFGPIPAEAEHFVASKPKQIRRVFAALSARFAPELLEEYRKLKSD